MSKFKFGLRQVKQLALLMNLDLTSQELSQFAKEMPQTLSAIANLNELDTQNIAPTYQTTGIVNRFQDEQINERNLDKKAIFKNAARTHHDYFQIKGLKYSK